MKNDIRMKVLVRWGALVLVLAAYGASTAQAQFFHPELEWKTIETDHFYVHYHNGAERTGATIAKIAEEIYGPVTALYHHEPDQKVSFIVNDVDDISNGAAYFYDNKVEIYAPSMDFVLRGTHNWLRNVITHEFTHIVQIQTSMKFGRRMPGIYLQWLGYESERRQDVLYGYPNTIVSYPLSGFVVPSWFAEGVAQFNRKELRYDFWDSHRDMILRSYVLDDTMLTWKQMGVFGKTSLGNESVYNAGFAFVLYLARKYGDDALNEISRNLARLPEVSIDGAIERAVGKSGADVYEDWKREITRDYEARVAPIREHLVAGVRIPFYDQEGDIPSGAEPPVFHRTGRAPFVLQNGTMRPCCRAVTDMSFANLYPQYSPDGSRFVFVSNAGSDYFSGSMITVCDIATRTSKTIIGPVSSKVSWSPDGNKLYYGKTTADNPHGSFQSDLYVYDLTKEEETRLTHGKRASSPSVSPDGRTLVFAVTADGTSNLALCDTTGSGFRLLTVYTHGEQSYDPQWTPDGKHIAFDYSVRDGRDIAWIRPDGTDLRFLVAGQDDARSPAFSPDGTTMLFSSDRTGISNLYAYDLATGTIRQTTNVLGGAFMPTVNAAGTILYAGYTATGYKLFDLANPSQLQEEDHSYLPSVADVADEAGVTLASTGTGGSSAFDWQALRSYDDDDLPAFSPRPYRSVYTSLSIVPFLRVDNYNTKGDALDQIKPGVYLFSNDVLEKTGFFAGLALNKRLDRDLFFQFNYRGKLPPLYQIGLEPEASLELYNVTRKSDTFLSLPLDTLNVEVGYDLLEFDFVLHQYFSRVFDAEFRFIHSRYTSILESFLLPESGILFQATSDLYLIANDFSVTFRLDAIRRASTDNINPVGRKVSLRVGRELNKFLNRYDLDNGLFVPAYDLINVTRVELNWKEYIPLFWKNHTLGVSFRGASIIAPPVDEFFDFYAGGLIGMRGYPFYAIGGNDLVTAGVTYRFPLVANIDARFLQFYFDKLYASVFADVGNAWTQGSPEPSRTFKKDVGAEIRLESFSFYAYPTRMFFSAAYGLDRFDRYIRSRDQTVAYGREWRFYFGILFGFDFD